MGRSSLGHWLAGRLRRRLWGLAPIVGIALILSAVLALMGWMIFPWLPPELHTAAATLQQGDIQAAGAALRSLLQAEISPLALIGIQVMQVVFAPIPGQLMGLLGGYVFGFGKGLLYTMTGLMLGSALAMGLGRYVGGPLVRRFVPPALLQRFDYLLLESGPLTFGLLFLLPAMPDDTLCFIAGLSRFPLPVLLLLCLLGRLPGMAVLSWAGSHLHDHPPWLYPALGGLIGVAFLAWLFQEELEAWVRQGTQKA
jgi:uncharacterized membrane protein YdjX (TVP38/TMEM64 family)